jgi:hypothetical protein
MLKARSDRHFWYCAALFSGLALLYMAPMLAKASWELLDMGVILREAQSLLANWRHATFPGTDRYLPILVAYYSVLWKLFGQNASLFFAAQALILAASLCLICRIIWELTSRLGWTALGGALFLTTSSLPENYYTLGKQEPRFVLLMLFSFYFYARAVKRAEDESELPLWPHLLPLFGASWFFLLLAYLTKETAFVMVPALALAAALEFFRPQGRRLAICALTGIAGHIFATAVFFMASHWVAGNPLPWKGKYMASRLGLSWNLDGWRAYSSMGLDVLVLTCATLLVLAPLLLQRRVRHSSALHCAAVAALAAAGHMGLLLHVWQQHIGYYLLPAAHWLAIAVPVLAFEAGHGVRRPYIRGVILGSAAFGALFSIPFNYSVARSQIIWNRTNGEMLRYAATLPSGARLFLSCSSHHEYLNQMHLLLKYLYNRSDLSVLGLDDLAPGCRKGDFLLANFGGPANNLVWTRAVNLPPRETILELAVKSMPGLEVHETYSVEQKAWIILPFSLRPKLFSLGWTGLQVASVPTLFLDRYGDGWLTSSNRLLIRGLVEPSDVVLKGRSFLPPALSYPINLKAMLHDRLLGSLRISQAGPFEFRFRIKPEAGSAVVQADSIMVVDLSADQTFNPSRFYGSADTRDLSVIVERFELEKVSNGAPLR